ncbi:uL15 family ribosomal protein [Candidatus Woesearchaeota archaeon]|nr:uL15 family ribosomal protein [Candidatus Woesearchaeota archaeon]
MVVRIRKKNVRERAHSTHGWGSRKRHRGSGSRGGYGMAGSGKRAQHKKQHILKFYGNEYYGRHGFHSMHKKGDVINIADIELHINKFGKKEGDHYLVNLKELGYDKLLGNGEVKNKLKVICNSFSASAKEKIEKAGGEISS